MASQLITCSNCTRQHESLDKFCPTCGYPVFGSEEEQQSFRLKAHSRQRLAKDARKKVRNAQIALYVVAGLTFLFGIIQFAMADSTELLISATIVSILYLALAAWANKNAFGALLTAIIIFVALWLLDIIVDPTYIFKGILIKIVIIVTLVKGIRSAYEANSVNPVRAR